jgi:hypothetical protein
MFVSALGDREAAIATIGEAGVAVEPLIAMVVGLGVEQAENTLVWSAYSSCPSRRSRDGIVYIVYALLMAGIEALERHRNRSKAASHQWWCTYKRH